MRMLISVVSLVMLYLQVYSRESTYILEPSSDNDKVNITSGDKFESSSDTMFKGGKWSSDFSVPGIRGTIYSTATDGVNLYVGGNFRIAGNIIANNIAKWDGHKWTSVGEGVENGVSGNIPTVHALAFADGKLFAGGQFSKAGSKEVNGIAYFDGEKWNKLGNDSIDGVRQIIFIDNDTMIYRGFVWSLFAYMDKVYAGGWFQYAGEELSNGIASWDINSESWESLDGGFRGINEWDQVTAYAFAADSNIIYMGGQFNFAGDLPAENVAAWDGQGWISLGKIDHMITDMETDYKGNLYVASKANPGWETGASGLMKWNGSIWESIPGPPEYETVVSTIEILDDKIFTGGSFHKDEFDADFAFAMFDGAEWHRINGLRKTQNLFFLGSIVSIESVGNRIFLAGDFTQAGEHFPVNVVEWDYSGSDWKILLDQTLVNAGIHDGNIRVLEQKGDTLYAGGTFTVAGGVHARNIAMYTHNGWQSLGKADSNGINGWVHTILIYKNDVYVGGSFNRAGPEASFHVARWDGHKWIPVGIGVGGVSGALVNALERKGDYLYVAGYFSVVGDVENYELPANSIARYNLLTDRWEAVGNGIEFDYGIPGIVYDLELSGDKIYVAGEFRIADNKQSENFAVLDGNEWTGMDGTDSIGVAGVIKVVKIIEGELYIGGYLYPDGSETSVGILKWDHERWSEISHPFEGKDFFVNDIAVYDSGFFAGGDFQSEEHNLYNVAWFNGSEWNSPGGGVTPGVSNLEAFKNRLFVAGPVEILTSQGLSVGLARFDFDYPDSVINDTTIQDTVITHAEFLHDHQDNIKAGNYPNPFDYYTMIYFSLENPGPVTIIVYDQQGRKVRELFNEFRPGGLNTVEFIRGDLHPGLYLYKIICNDYRLTRRMIRR